MNAETNQANLAHPFITALLESFMAQLDRRIEFKVQEAIGDKITELFESRIEALIAEKMDEAIEAAVESAIEDHTSNETHGADIDDVVEQIFGSHKFDRRIANAIEESIDSHCSDYDHDQLEEVENKLNDYQVDERIQDALNEHTANEHESEINEEQIDERVREALKYLSVQVTWTDTPNT